VTQRAPREILKGLLAEAGYTEVDKGYLIDDDPGKYHCYRFYDMWEFAVNVKGREIDFTTFDHYSDPKLREVVDIQPTEWEKDDKEVKLDDEGLKTIRLYLSGTLF